MLTSGGEAGAAGSPPIRPSRLWYWVAGCALAFDQFPLWGDEIAGLQTVQDGGLGLPLPLEQLL
jgi:hypothetical protein